MCEDCASLVEMGPRCCPVCFGRFSRSASNGVARSRGSSIEMTIEQEDRPAWNYNDSSSLPPSAAIIGAGFLGCRIAAELLLIGAEVSVYDRCLAALGRERGQIELQQKVFQPILESGRQGLLHLAGISIPTIGRPWEPCKGWGPRTPQWCASVTEAVHDKAIVIDCVPDDIRIKTEVFLEAARSAPPGVLLATSTVSLPLNQLQASVDARLVSGYARKPRVVGLRFLAPVVFVPFVEVTLTVAQNKSDDRTDLMTVLDRWGKGAFVCDVQGAAESGNETDDIHATAQRYRLGFERLRLDSNMAKLRQMGEARLRKARRVGPAAVAALRPSELFIFDNGEERCCICLTDAPTVASVLCGHCCLCESCASLVEAGQRQCPLCRFRFVRSEQSSEQRISRLLHHL